MHSPEDGIPPINRESPEVIFQAGERTLSLTYNNSCICEFDEPYADLGHVLIVLADRDVYVFGDKELRDTLYDEHFPYTRNPFPSNLELKRYVDWQRSQFDKQAAALLSRRKDT